MKWILLTTAFGITLFFLFYLHPNVSLKSENVFDQPQFVDIFKKVSLYFDQHPDSQIPTMEDLLDINIISQDDYDYLKSNRIRYNDPASAGSYDNTIPLFERDNGDCTSSHIIVMISDTSDPDITHSGTMSLLEAYVEEWFAFQSDKKTLFVFNNDNFYYFDLSYYNNAHWNHQHLLSVSVMEENPNLIEKLTKRNRSV